MRTQQKRAPLAFPEEAGPRKLIFGSDAGFGPFKGARWRIEQIRQLPVSEEERQWILGENIAGLLKWEPV